MSKAAMIVAVGLALLLFGSTLSAQVAPGLVQTSEPSASTPQGEPVPGPALHDRDFGVVTRQFGLDRQVEMYQWQAAGDGYRQVWNAGRIDSANFSAGHENPPMPLDSRRWWSQGATLDGNPIADTVLQAIGEWHWFRPNFSRLPANLAAAFQPEGDGLGSAENPLDPQVGDLRVTWRELRLPPLPGRVELRDGVWQLSAQTAAAALNATPLPPVISPSAVDTRVVLRFLPALLLGLALLLMTAWIFRRRRR